MRDLVVVLLTVVVLIGGSLALFGLDAPDGSLRVARCCARWSRCWFACPPEDSGGPEGFVVCVRSPDARHRSQQ
ncbi:hypothetical protein [Nonomuraea sp. NPDC049504]|uniref:hypothetical protein n=1 Tax=Nonomuraea sp. NPDC049504 TaxID=3154729 RepID=UPI003439203E